MNPTVTQLSTRLLLITHEVCGTIDSVDNHPLPVTDEEMGEIQKRVNALFTPEGLHNLVNPEKPVSTVKVSGSGRNITKTRTGPGVKL